MRIAMPEPPAVALPVEADGNGDPEGNCLHQPLLKRKPTLTSTHLAMVEARMPHVLILDHVLQVQINENELFELGWRRRSSCWPGDAIDSRACLVTALRTAEWDVRERFASVGLAEKGYKVEEISWSTCNICRPFYVKVSACYKIGIRCKLQSKT